MQCALCNIHYTLYSIHFCEDLELLISEKRSLFSEPMPFLGEISEEENVNITFVPKIKPGSDKPSLTEDEIEYFIEDKDYNFWGKR